MDPILKQLKDALAENAREAEDICAKAEADGRELTDDEDSTVTTLLAECKDIKENRIPAREAAIKRRAEISGFAKEADEPQRPPTRGSRIGDIRVKGEGFEDDPKCGFKTPREFLTCVMDAGQGRKRDNRLTPLAAAGSDEQGEYHDAFGGFLVPEGFSPQLLRRSPESDPTMGRTRMLPMMSPRLNITARVDSNHTSSVSGGFQIYRRAEADTVSATRMELEQVTLNAHTLFGLAYATDEILTDSPITVAALIADGFGDEFQNKKFREKLQGTGVGEYEGINNTPALVTVSKESGQAAATIVYENVIKMYARCWGKDNAIWIANHDCLPQLMLMNHSIGTGGVPVWQPSAREGEPNMLLGRPIFFSEHTETVGTAGDIILCNWNEYLEGELGGTNSASSIHVRFVNAETAFRFYQRNDGRSWWRAALTTDNGSTLSPFVRLATRA